MIRNFISNALKFTPTGGNVTITINACSAGNHLKPKRNKTSYLRKQSLGPIHPTSIYAESGTSTSELSSNQQYSLPKSLVGNAYSENNDEKMRHSSVNKTMDGDDNSAFNTNNYVLVFSVTDTGPGIDKDDQKKVFNEIIQFNPNMLQVS